MSGWDGRWAAAGAGLLYLSKAMVVVAVAVVAAGVDVEACSTFSSYEKAAHDGPA